MKYFFKKFETHNDYLQYDISNNYTFDNSYSDLISYCGQEDEVHYDNNNTINNKMIRVQYLESTGTQYMNLEYIPKGTDIVEARVKSTVTTGLNYSNSSSNYPLFNPIFGVQNSGSHGFWAAYVKIGSNNRWRYYYYNTYEQAVFNYYGGNLSNSSYITTTYTFVYNKNTLTRNGTALSPAATNPANSPSLLYPMYLFYVNTEAGNVQTSGQTSKLQIEHFSVKSEDQTIILDLVPVRIGNIGYMYDNVSGKLFKNKGTGSFIVGPDITV